MTQRKLTDEELQAVNTIRRNIGSICDWRGTILGVDHWVKSARSLDEMFHNGTTDGKPYIEPEPPIPDGYRKAVAGDEGRADCKFWSADGEWKQRCFVGRDFEDGMRYAVPVDLTPTDDEAKSRPTIMVRDCESHSWTKATLYGVRSDGGGYWYIAVLSHGLLGCWKYARHLYSGE